MATISDDRMAFMRHLGITEEDVLDPSMVITENNYKKNDTETRFEGDSSYQVPLNVNFVKTSRSIFPIAESLKSKAEPLQKAKPFQWKGIEGRSTTGASPGQLKVDGNRAFEEGRYCEALNYYTNAIDSLLESGNYQLKENGHLNIKGDGINAVGFGAGDPRTILLAALFSNRSASYLQAAKQIGAAEALESAIRDADRAVELRPTWFKGYSRQGDAFFKMKKYCQAVEAYEMALQFDPGNNNLIQSVQEARQRRAAEARENVQSMKNQSTQPRKERNAASVTFVPVAVPSPANVPANNVSAGRRESGHLKTTARQLWNEFKPEVEASVHQPTGDDYRREQLRLFREQKEREKTGALLSSCGDSRTKDEALPKESSTEKNNTGSTGSVKNPSSRKGRPDYVPEEFSSDAAAAYQQRLLEEYRRRKAQRM